MTPLRFEPATARDLHAALRMLTGRLLGEGKHLSPGAQEIFEAAERSLQVRSDQLPAGLADRSHDATVLDLLTIDEVADRLHLSRSTVQRHIWSGDLASVKIGRNRRIRPDDLRTFIDNLQESA